MKLTLNLNPPQIREDFKSLSSRAYHGNFFETIKRKFKKKKIFLDMLMCAYGKRISKKTLKKLLRGGWFQLDHVVAATMDEPNNFFETSSVPDPESAFNCPGASPSPPRHRRDAVPEFIPTHRSCPPQLMIKNLNNKFGRNTEQAFKKKHTGLGWVRAVNLIDTAIELQHSLGRL